MSIKPTIAEQAARIVADPEAPRPVGRPRGSRTSRKPPPDISHFPGPMRRDIKRERRATQMLQLRIAALRKLACEMLWIAESEIESARLIKTRDRAIGRRMAIKRILQRL